MVIKLGNIHCDVGACVASVKRHAPWVALVVVCTWINLRYLSPFLLRHGSSAAFELMMALGTANLIGIVEVVARLRGKRGPLYYLGLMK